MAAALCCLMTLALLPRSQPARAAEAAAEPPSYYLQYKAETGGCTLELYLNTPAGHPAILSGSFGLSYPAAATLSFQSGEAVNLLWDNSASGDATLVDDSTRKYYVFSWARVTTDEGLLHIGTFTVAAADALDIENFSLLDWAKTREAGDGAGGHAPDEEIWRAADITAGETQGAYQGFYGGTNGLFVQTDIPFDAPTSGVIVSGKVSSYDPKKDLTVKLYQWDEEKATYAAQATYSITIPGDSAGYDACIQSFSFSNIQTGKYLLQAGKAAHLCCTINGLMVGNENLDLSKDQRVEVSTLLLRCGDINSDGAITIDDYNVLIKGSNFNHATEEVGVEPYCDLNGDGAVTVDDLNLLMSDNNFNRQAVIVDYIEKEHMG